MSSINVQLESCRLQTVNSNREYLRNVIETNLFLAKQNIAFRGPDESANSLNQGNFLELFSLRTQDVPIHKHKAKYSNTSHTAQNQILKLLACEIILILSECKDRLFALIVDETSDISNDEQVLICIRYVDDQF